MAPRHVSRFTLAALAATLIALAAGCSKNSVGILPVFVNQRPTVEFTAAPVNEADTAYYAYEMHWSGNDPDGAVDRYEYAIDPVGGIAPETTWVVSRMSQAKIYFRTWQPDTLPGGRRAYAPHTFVLRAVDAQGLASEVASRSFFSYTIAPTVRITSPTSGLGFPRTTVGSSLRISWEGEDEDGAFSRLPVKYKYRLLRPDDPEFSPAQAIAFPQQARAWFSSTNFAGWDSTGPESTSVELRGLELDAGPFAFLVVAFDEAGAWSADWSTAANILAFNTSTAVAGGPAIGVTTSFGSYAQAVGSYSPYDPAGWWRFEMPTGAVLSFCTHAQPALGTRIAGYRWKLDGDVGDETPRTDERTDWLHWSRWSLESCHEVGPFVAPGMHLLYIEAQDDFGTRSIIALQIIVVDITRHRELLVVDDTRLEVDRYSGGSRLNYSGLWPAAAELDTFLYAVGGKPWRGLASGRAGVSPPGLFAGYSFDTLGTRAGYEIPTASVPLSLLGRYRRVLWITDATAATKLAGPTDVINGMSTMRWMSDVGRSNVLLAYAAAGGDLWLAGGSLGYCATIEYDATGTRNNNGVYGPGYSVFSSAAGELGPARVMYDLAHWRSEFVSHVAITGVNRSSRAVGGWSHLDGRGQPVVAPDYALLPATLRRRSAALGDTLPPTRPTSQASRFFTAGSFAIEYLTQPNSVVEDVDPDPLVTHEISTLDTLYEFSGGTLATNITGQRPASMTYYHGTECPKVLATGFPLWEWTRSDCQELVDFVLQRIWGMSRSSAPTVGAARPVASAGAPARALHVRR